MFFFKRNMKAVEHNWFIFCFMQPLEVLCCAKTGRDLDATLAEKFA